MQNAAKKSRKSILNPGTELVRTLDVNWLIANPRHKMCTSYTEDLESGLRKDGVFTDPIIVTDFRMEDGKYMIVSGHRRVEACKKVGVKTIRGIIRSYRRESDMLQEGLNANLTRTEENDPLFIPNIIWEAKEVVQAQGLTWGVNNAIKEITGYSLTTVERGVRFLKCIPEVRDMVSDRKVAGWLSLAPVGSFGAEEQLLIKRILEDVFNNGETLTSKRCEQICKNFMARKRNYNEVY